MDAAELLSELRECVNNGGTSERLAEAVKKAQEDFAKIRKAGEIENPYARISALEYENKALREEIATLRGWRPWDGTPRTDPENGLFAVVADESGLNEVLATFCNADGYGWFGPGGIQLDHVTQYYAIPAPGPQGEVG